jgi:pimeloyl-ACP methyl ester carboxylesterase
VRRATLPRIDVALAAVALTTACAGPGAQVAAPAGQLSQEACTGIPAHDARCYRLAVPESRQAPARTIGLRIVVLPATGTERAADPIVFLAGGPGQAATDLIRDPAVVRSVMRDRRDVVLADQRGTGGSNGLHCRFYGPPDVPQSYFDAFLPIDKVRACRRELESRADLAQYTTSASVDDLEAIRVALGYSRLNLVGGSYGTRLALEYVRRHETRVRAVVLESPVTPAVHAPEHFGRYAAAALDALIDECAASAPCAKAFPALRDEARAVFDRLRAAPMKTVVAHPSGGVPGEVTVSRDHVGEVIRYMMYSAAGGSRVPLFLHEASRGNYAPIAEFLIRWRASGTFDGLYLSITCAEDVPLVAADAAERDDPTYLGGYRVRQQRAACAEWPRGTAPLDHVDPVRSPVPTLILSGMLDPVTRPANGDDIARTLTNRLHLRIPSSGHSPDGLRGLECLAELKHRFLERASVAGLDASCVSRIARPGFVAGDRLQ